MGIEPYAIRSGLRAVVAQRLVRRLCPECSTPSDQPEDLLGLPVARRGSPGAATPAPGPATRAGSSWPSSSCPTRTSSARPSSPARDVHQLEQIALAAGMINRWERACQAVEQGLTSAAEVRRVLGVANPARAGGGE